VIRHGAELFDRGFGIVLEILTKLVIAAEFFEQLVDLLRRECHKASF